MYHIYELFDPRNGEVRYVGMTTNPKTRLRHHILRPGRNPRKKSWIKELLSLGLEPQMRTIEIIDDREKARERESYWIQEYYNKEINLTNMNSTYIPADIRARLRRLGY